MPEEMDGLLSHSSKLNLAYVITGAQGRQHQDHRLIGRVDDTSREYLVQHFLSAPLSEVLWHLELARLIHEVLGEYDSRCCFGLQ